MAARDVRAAERSLVASILVRDLTLVGGAGGAYYDNARGIVALPEHSIRGFAILRVVAECFPCHAQSIDPG